MRCGGEATYWKLNQSAEVHQSFTMFESRAVRHGLLFQHEIFFFKKDRSGLLSSSMTVMDGEYL